MFKKNKRFIIDESNYIDFYNYTNEKFNYLENGITLFVFQEKRKNKGLKCNNNFNSIEQKNKNKNVNKVNFKAIFLKLNKEKSDYVIIPNREGEKINLKKGENKLNKFLKENNLNINFAKIVYPSIASTNLIVFKIGKKLFFLYSPSNKKFLVTNYIIKEDEENLYIEINSCEKYWLFFNINLDSKINDISDIDSNIKAYSYAKNLINKINNKFQAKIKESKIYANYFIQVGFISPDLYYDKNNKIGFMVLKKISELIKNKLGNNNIIHIFGYSKGHDIDYPDYTPSKLLGGLKLLKKAIEEVHKNNQKVSIYLNSRIASKELVDQNKVLKKAIFYNEDGNCVIEKYNERKFYVMNPDSKIWIKTLLKWVKLFKKIKVDGIQLDQIGGREALTKPCSNWGKGYYKLIKKIQKNKMFVWIQGCSSIYPADIYELTYRKPKILKNGIIRGGTPIGESNFLPIILVNTSKMFLIPLSKLKYIPENLKIRYVIDIEYEKGRLFIYNEDYLKNLEDSIEKFKIIKK